MLASRPNLDVLKRTDRACTGTSITQHPRAHGWQSKSHAPVWDSPSQNCQMQQPMTEHTQHTSQTKVIESRQAYMAGSSMLAPMHARLQA